MSRHKTQALWALGGCLLLVAACAACVVLTSLQKDVFDSVPAQPKAAVLEGEVDWRPGMTKYLGGFCFGATDGAKDADGIEAHAGLINTTLSLGGRRTDSQKLAAALTHMHLLLYDDQPQHWGAMLRGGEDASCREMKAKANVALPLSSVPWLPAVVYINQRMMARHWHALLVDCAPKDAPDANSAAFPHLQYTITALDALSFWGAGDRDPADCPQDLLKMATQSIGTLFA